MRRELHFGTLATRMFANLRLIWPQLLAYLAAVVALAFALPLAGEAISSTLGLVLYLGGQYWLFRTLIKARGLLETQRIHGFAFAGLALVLVLPIMFGVAAFVLPGLFLVARWIAAPAFIVARGEGAFSAASSSWHSVRGHTLKIAGMIALIFVLVSMAGSLTNALDSTLSSFSGLRNARPIDVIEAHLFPLLLFALSTATYELLGPEDTTIEEVFG